MKRHYCIGLTFLFLLLFIKTKCTAQEIEVHSFPESVQLGDTFYVVVTIFNNTGEVVRYNDLPLMVGAPDTKRFALSRGEAVYEWIPEVTYYLSPDTKIGTTYDILPNNQLSALVMSFQFPSLEDLYSEFWKEETKELADHPKGLVYQLELIIQKPYSESLAREDDKLSFGEMWEKSRLYLKTNISLRLRFPEEMTLINQWYDNTPMEIFPKIAHPSRSLPKCKSLFFLWAEREEKAIIANEKAISNKSFIMAGNRRYIPWQFISIGSRYPSDHNVPETWQGWKELESSLSPSTMRDEIRLTRIIIQYCDMKDKKVLEELKEWFAEMNEIQRACMAKSVLERAVNNAGCQSLFSSYRDLYHTIREYDISAKTERRVEALKRWKLLE